MSDDTLLGLTPAWAGIDTEWYKRVYRAELQDVELTAQSIDVFYHGEGVRLHHSPNPFFDERWYLAKNPDVSEAIRAGTFASGFEHYGLIGHKTRSPHWLFSETFYLAEYPDLTADLLAAGHYANGYDHYLRTGDREWRSGHLLFDPAMHHEAAALDSGRHDGSGEYRRFLTGNRRVGSSHRLSWYFDPIWYLNSYPEVAAEIDAGQWSCALEHYLGNGRPAAFNPGEHFSEQYYRDLYLDIHPALDRGTIRNAFDHFIHYGAVERRSPLQTIDLQGYFRAVTVQTDIEQRHVRDAFAHFERSGGTPRPIPGQLEVAEVEGRKLYVMACENMLPALTRHPLDFRFDGEPAVSVIIVCSNQFAFTMATLASLRANYPGAMQIVLIDNGSRDDVRRIEDFVLGLEIIRYTFNSGFVAACNAGLERARADATLYLNNDVQISAGSIHNALQRLWSSESIGCVGGKIIRSHGKLQEAGSIIWRDGWATGYLRNADPNLPEANFVRTVDFCSGAFLMCKTSVLRRLGGFDIDYSPAYFEDADLCVRMHELGYATVYDPSVCLVHYEYGSTSMSVSNAMMQRNHPIFRRNSAEFLRRKSFNVPALETAARAVAPSQKRILFVEDRLPFRHLGSGFTRSNDIVHAMVALGYHVTLYPIYRPTETIATVFQSFPDTVEVIYDRELPDLEAFVTARAGYFDAVWIARTHNADRLTPVLARCAASLPTSRVVLDTEAVAAARNAARDLTLGVPLHQTPRTVADMTRDELQSAFVSQRIVAVNEVDAALIHAAGFSDVDILGHMQTARDDPPGWSERADILFLASIPDSSSPNLDALSWFSAEVLPLLDGMLPADVVFTVAGNISTTIDLSMLRRNRRVRTIGRVDELGALYDRHRLVVAPTRFAGGVPYKIHEAAANGVPIVASSLLCRQVGWTEGQDIACAKVGNARQFADAIVDLYFNEHSWTQMQQSALARIRDENAPATYRERLAGILARVFA